MKTAAGVPVCTGVAMGTLQIWRRNVPQEDGRMGSAEEELARFAQARRQAGERLESQRQKALSAAGEEGADIFRLHRMLLDDEDYGAAVEAAIRTEGRDARTAVLEAGEQFAARFRALDDPYLQGRADDLEAVSRLIAGILAGVEEELIPLEEPAILAACGLAPGQLIGLDREKVLGLVLSGCSPNGHTAILARAMAVPTVMEVAPDPDWQGRPAALDGDSGILYVEPDEAAVALLEAKGRRAEAERQRLAELMGAPAVSPDGQEIALLANIGSESEVELALEHGAQGVGLFRTELLCLGRDSCPGEEEQFEVYRRVIERMDGRRVVIRTFDLGGDKQVSWLPGRSGENPALGLRGIRLSLARPELFRSQLRAVLRAAAFGPAAVMFPMVTSVEEVRQAKALLSRCREELKEEGLSWGPVEVGVMIETPAAALLADELAEEAEFFSIGTNDLTQYTLAADRQDPALAGLCDPKHPAVLELVRRAAEAARRRGRRAAVCGQLGADPSMAETFLALGLDELSVPPGDIPVLRAKIRGLGPGRLQ